jgi:outer membrane lipoprotein-sorting protein
MKKISFLAFLMPFLAFSFATKAQSAEEIIDKYLKAVGGVEKLKSIKSIKTLVKFKQQGMEIPAEMLRGEKGKTRTSFTFQGKEMVQTVFDGEKGWNLNFMTQKSEPMESEDVENMKREAVDFPEPFLNYAAKGYKIELMGKEKKEGTDCYKIKLIKKSQLVDGVETDNEVVYFFDTENFLPIVTETTFKKGPAKGKIMQIVMSDYQEVDGMLFPFSITQSMEGNGSTVQIEKLELNVPLDDKLFAEPGK